MHNFPVPYENELIYSVIARAGVHAGIISPKQLLDEVFEDRKVVATIDLPCHLKSIAKNLNNNPKFSPNKLIDNHTLFPVYTPFINPRTRKKVRKMMKGSRKGTVHLSLGVAASRLNHSNVIKYCTHCLKRQLKQHGEMYWERQWQYYGIDVCEHHGRLSELAFNSTIHRHEYVTPGKQQLHEESQLNKIQWEQVATEEFSGLLNREQSNYPSFEQWTSFYQVVAHDYACNRGNQVNHDAVSDRVQSLVPKIWMDKKGVTPSDKETSWLKSIFRKHRKAFSFLEHLIVIKSFMPSESVAEVITQASKLGVGRPRSVNRYAVAEPDISDRIIHQKRSKWRRLLSQYGTKIARNKLDGGALYAWLYRHDREWLLATNSVNKVFRGPCVQRVDWAQRDNKLTKKLAIIVNERRELKHPRITKNWLISQLPHNASITKNLYRLPLLSELINANSESITEYQLRRLECASIEIKAEGEEVKLWKLYRKAGLSKERITPRAQRGLKKFGITT